MLTKMKAKMLKMLERQFRYAQDAGVVSLYLVSTPRNCGSGSASCVYSVRRTSVDSVDDQRIEDSFRPSRGTYISTGLRVRGLQLNVPLRSCTRAM